MPKKLFILSSFLFLFFLSLPAFAYERSWEWAIGPIYEVDESTFSGGVHFSEGLAAVKKGGKYGYIDKDGKEVIPFLFEKAGPFNEGLAAASVDGLLMGFIKRVEPPEPTTEPPTPTPTPKPTPTPIPTPVAANIPSGDKKTAYLTIDDGPSRVNTPAVLDILKENNVKATFFVLPIANVDDLYKRIVNEGHAIANHSYSHDLKKLYAADDLTFFKDDFKKAHDYIQGKTGTRPKIYRFPGGSGGRAAELMNPRYDILKGMGYRHFNWDVSTGDTDTSPAGKNVDALVNNVVLNTKNRNKLIILMHDSADKTATVKALPIIIKKLKEMGYEFDTLENY